MDFKVPGFIKSISPYVPGKPIEELEREYGIQKTIKLASNENPLGPSPMAVEAISAALGNLHRYPDGSGFYLCRAISEHYGIDPGTVVLGNGSDEVLSMLARGFMDSGDSALMPVPAFLMYDIVTRVVGGIPVTVPLNPDHAIDLDAMADAVTGDIRIVFLTNPNNPTGSYFTKDAFDLFLGRIPENVIVVLDEAYHEFADPAFAFTGVDYLGKDPRVVTLRTFSKAYGLAGLRIGYGVMDPEVAAILNRFRPPFNANSLAQVGALAALSDTGFLEKSVSLVREELAYLYTRLDAMGLPFIRSQANFFLIDVSRPAQEVFEAMLAHGVIVRSMKSYGFPHHIRMNAGTREENDRFLAVLETVLR